LCLALLWVMGMTVLLFMRLKFDFGKAKPNPYPFLFSVSPFGWQPPLWYVECR